MNAGNISSPPVEIDPKLIEAFHLMYDHFPEPASLVHKSRLVMAVNPACQIIGRAPGMVCARQGAAEAHRGCLAGEAVRLHRARHKKIRIPVPASGEAGGASSPAPAAPPANPRGPELSPPRFRDIIAFWLPVDGQPDFYIHFAVGATMDY